MKLLRGDSSWCMDLRTGLLNMCAPPPSPKTGEPEGLPLLLYAHLTRGILFLAPGGGPIIPLFVVWYTTAHHRSRVAQSLVSD
jgi:hypothetical protein